MFLELMALNYAMDADSKASRAAEAAERGLDAMQRSSSSSAFLFFEELDYSWDWKSGEGFFSGSERVVTGKKSTKTSIPLGNVKSITEENPKDWYWSDDEDEDDDMTQPDRLKMFHTGKVVVIRTFSGEKYYLEGTLEEFTQKFKGKAA